MRTYLLSLAVIGILGIGLIKVALGRDGPEGNSIKEVGRLQLDFDPMSVSYIRELYAYGDYLYVLTYSPAVLWLIDVSDPAEPYVKNSLSLSPRYGHDLWYSDGYIYIGYRWGGLHMIDVSDPLDLKILDFVQTDYIHRGLYTVGHYLYYGEHQAGDQVGGLVIFDTSDGKLKQVGAYLERDLDGKWPVVTSDGRYAYQVIGDAGLSQWRVNIYDVSDKAHPQYVGSFHRGIKAREMALSPDDRFLFIASHESGLQIFDITHRTSPQLVKVIEGEDITTLTLDEENAILYVVDGGTKLLAVDVSNPYAATIVETVSGVNVNQISESGGYIYAGAGGWEFPEPGKNWIYIYTKYSPEILRPSEEKAVIAVQNAIAFPGDSIGVHLKIRGKASIAGGKFLLSYDPAKLTVLDVQSADLTSDFVLTNILDQENGKLGISMAGAFGTEKESGNLAEVTFLVSPDVAIGDTVRIDIADFSLVDEGVS